MRRIRLALALPLLVLFAQQGAVLHELSHVYYAGQPLGSQLHQDQQLPDNSLCPTCQGFAQVAHPAVGFAALHIPPSAPHLRTPDPAYRMAPADAPRPRSRGPPQIRA
jgi:hypothetical protein